MINYSSVAKSDDSKVLAKSPKHIRVIPSSHQLTLSNLSLTSNPNVIDLALFMDQGISLKIHKKKKKKIEREEHHSFTYALEHQELVFQ